VNPARQPAVSEFMGAGVLVSNGDMWHRSRNLIKPAFKRAQITDHKMFAVHVERFMSLLPQDGDTVDLAPLFSRLVSAVLV
jgi:cytochrome P450